MGALRAARMDRDKHCSDNRLAALAARDGVGSFARGRLPRAVPRGQTRGLAPARVTMIEAGDLQALERSLREGIPLARAMDVRVLDYDGNRLALGAPLAPNVNDKGNAFGGSLSSLLTLAAWGLVNLKLAEAGLAADVYIQDANLSYLAPVWGELIAEAYAEGDAWPGFVAAMRDKGRARITLLAEIAGADGAGTAARQSARFVAKVPAG